jgi:hypothetical protein
LAILVAFYGTVFAEKNTSYYTLAGGYSGLGWNAVFHWAAIKSFGKENNFLIIPGVGFGLVEKGIIALSADLQFGTLLPDNPQVAMVGGMNYKISGDVEFVPYIGLNWNGWVSTLGYSLCSKEENSGLSFSTGYIFKRIKNIPEAKKDSIEKPAAAESSGPRYFRPGIEFNYPVNRSKIDFFDNSFPYTAWGIGLFFRIGPEPIYFTTGAYAKQDVLHREETQDLSVLGIPIARLPLLDITWSRLFVEVPLLLSFGSGQIRFTGGALLDFYALSEIDIDVLNNRVLSINDADSIEERFEDIPSGNIYWALGLDIDIVRHWGIGVKFLIWYNTFGEPEQNSEAFEPSHYQTRVSTYFVF